MAISPLALGIGLQGKYDYRQQAALEMSRAKGRAKAEADEEAAKEKKRAEIRKMIVNIKPQGLLPFQQKIIDDNVADALNYAAENQDDFSGVTQRVFEIESRSKAYRDQAEGYKRLSLQQGGMPVDAQVLKAVGTLSDPREIQEYISKYGPATSIAITGDQLTLDNPKYEGLGTTFSKFVKPTMFDPNQGVKEIMIGDRKYGDAEINTEVPKILTATIMNTDNLKRSAFNDYLQYAIQNDKPYDFSTEQGQKEFYDNTTKFVNDNAKSYIDSLSKQYGGSKTQFTTNVSMGADSAISDVINWSEGNKYQFGEEGIPDSYIISEGGALPVTKNKTVVLANNDAIWDVKSGERITEANVTEGTYNEPALVYKAKERYKFPETQLKMQDGSYRTLPARIFEKNEPLRGGYAYAMAQKGKAKAGYVAFGIIKDGSSETKVVRNLGDVGISEFIDAGKYKQRQLDEIYKTAKAKKDALQKKINSYYQAPSSPAPTPPQPPVVEKKAATPPTKAKPTTQSKEKPANTNAAQKSGEKPKKQPPKGTEDIFGELEKAAKPKNK